MADPRQQIFDEERRKQAIEDMTREADRSSLIEDAKNLEILKKRVDLLHGEITEETVKELNKIAMSGCVGSGEYRKVNVSYGDAWGVPWEAVPSEMAHWVQNLSTKSETPISEVAIVAHLELLRIHAFVDANGRASRMLLNLLLLKNNLDPVLIPFEKEFEYIRCVSKYTLTSPENPVTTAVPTIILLQNLIQSQNEMATGESSTK